MKRPSAAAPAPAESPALRLWTLAFGGFLGLAFLKFPNPALMDALVSRPTNGWEWLLTAWPLDFAWPLLGVLTLTGVALASRPRGLGGWVLLPAVWLAWVGVSALAASGSWSGKTLAHYAAGTACFYLGLTVAGRVRSAGWLLAGLAAAMAWVLYLGWDQHFGGLARSREYFFLYTFPKLETVSPDLLKRVNSERIFSTLFYPNSLAGALLLTLPALLGWVIGVREHFTTGARVLLAGLMGAAGVGCLVWSGSKTGWLLALAMGVVAMLRLPLARRTRLAIVGLVLVVGLGGFAARHLGFFQKGATSVVARGDYYRAGLRIAGSHPLLGTGPGTFGKNYERIKASDAEMAQLAHNDYLQQACDSGWPAAGLFAAFVGWVLWRTRGVLRAAGSLEFGVWLGLAGLATQSLVEFGFMVPATTWCWFALAGWLMARIGFDKGTTSR